MNKSTVAFLIGIAITAALALIILASISAGTLWSLIGGVIALGVIMIGLSWIGVTLFARLTESRYKMRSLQYDHIESVMRLGYQPGQAGYVMLPAPQTTEYDIPISTSGETQSTIEAHRPDALELLALTKQWHATEKTSDKQQIIPHRYAKKDSYFAGETGFERWHSGMIFLTLSSLADERKQGNRSLGTFARGCTATQLADRLLAGQLTTPPR